MNDFKRAGSDTAYINNLVLIYNGYYECEKGNWSSSDFLPYLLYKSGDGSYKNKLFDGFLFLGLLAENQNQFFEATDPCKASTMQDWDWYLNKTFGENGDLQALSNAVKKAREYTGDNELSAKTVLMLPFPSVQAFNGVKEQKAAILSYVDKCIKMYSRFEAEGTVSLKAFYWLHEDSAQEELISYARELTHSHNLKYFWIPYFNANGYDKWRELGFDAAVLQPNHFFNGTKPEQVQKAAELANQLNMGIELEFDERAFDDEEFYNKYIDYLDGAKAYGYGQKDVFKAYYQDVKAILNASEGKGRHARELYEKTCALVFGVNEDA